MHIVRIGGGSTEQHSADAIGAKAANLARMAALGLPVPPAFVLPVKLCAAIIDKDAHAERHLCDGLKQGIAFLESATGKRLGDRRQPLLVSVRSGAARSMPGMLDTVLNVGCTSAAVQGLIRMTGRPRLAWDCRRRFLESFSETVLGLNPGPFAARVAELTTSEGVGSDCELDSEALERLAALHYSRQICVVLRRTQAKRSRGHRGHYDGRRSSRNLPKCYRAFFLNFWMGREVLKRQDVIAG